MPKQTTTIPKAVHLTLAELDLIETALRITAAAWDAEGAKALVAYDLVASNLSRDRAKQCRLLAQSLLGHAEVSR